MPKSGEQGEGGPQSGISQLKRTLWDVVKVSTGAQEQEGDEDGVASPGGASPTLSPAEARAKREQKRPSPAFQASSRERLNKLDVTNRFRAPPPGSYRPKDDLARPRLKGTDFGLREPTKSLKSLEIEREVERLHAEKLPYDHLVKTANSVELLEHFPSKAKAKLPTYDFAKVPSRPDLVKSANITYNDNSFTAGVLEGDLRCSHLTRKPEWDFAKLSTASDKPHETYFQPGQYKKELSPATGTKNIPFGRQTDRKPLTITKRAGDHLPDRSLSRICSLAPGDDPCSRSCPLLSRELRVSVPSFAKYKKRADFYVKKADYHARDDPEVDQAVLRHALTFDLTTASKAVQSRAQPPEDFKKSLTRQEHLKRLRSYGTDPALSQAKENLSRGPVSVELLSDIDASPSLRQRVKTREFSRVVGRDVHKECSEPPPRKRDLSEAAKFERSTREGDSRSLVKDMSPMAGKITTLRAERSYEYLNISRRKPEAVGPARTMEL